MRIVAAVLAGLILLIGSSAAFAKPNGVLIREKTKFYTIDGKTAAEFALSMHRNGPYSRQHRRSAWAITDREITFQLVRQKFKNNCRVRDAKIKLEITYTMPKVRSFNGVSKRERRKWRRMYAILNKHERVHGRYYKQLALNARKQLRKLKPARTCFSLDRMARALFRELSEVDRQRNDRFDVRDSRNYRRMERIFSN